MSGLEKIIFEDFNKVRVDRWEVEEPLGQIENEKVPYAPKYLLPTKNFLCYLDLSYVNPSCYKLKTVPLL